MDQAEFILWSRYYARKAQAKQLAAKMADRRR
jgi:hypothetical protein